MSDSKQKYLIKYVAIKVIVTYRNGKVMHSEFSMHQPNRHENVHACIKQFCATHLANEEIELIEGFKTDCGKFLTRKEAMDLYREDKLYNGLRAEHRKPEIKEMQSIYLW